jgi:Tfp pilus assembly protein PilX
VKLRTRLKNERGLALPMALGIMVVLALMLTTLITYTTSNTRASYQSKTRNLAFTLAEAGMNDAVGVLNEPSVNALDPDVMAKCTNNYGTGSASPNPQTNWQHNSYSSGTVDWCGDLDRANAIWYLKAIGKFRNVNSATTYVTKTQTAQVTVVPNLTQPLNNPVWNYIYSGHTGSTCDQTLNNNVSGASRMYVAGNLCIGNNANVSQSAIVVGGNLTLSGGNTAVGANTNMSTRVETFVGGNCSFGTGTPVTCTGNQDANKIFSKITTSPPCGTAPCVGVNHTPPVVPAPVADFATWYENAIPGPSQSCTTSSGTVPTFDTNYPNRDNSVATPFILTPATAYDCRVGTASNPSGEIKWTPPTSTEPGQLYMQGTIFIDGSATVTTGTASSTFAVQYSGQSTLYLSGTFYLNGKLCASLTSAKYDCSFPSWNPNSTMMTIVANGSGGQVNPGDSIQVINNGEFQGALFGTNVVEFGNNSYSDGPIVGSSMIFGNNVSTNAFPTITTVPVGMPSNPAVYAQPNPPQNFSG